MHDSGLDSFLRKDLIETIGKTQKESKDQMLVMYQYQFPKWLNRGYVGECLRAILKYLRQWDIMLFSHSQMAQENINWIILAIFISLRLL